MKESDLNKAFGSTPESVKECISHALNQSRKVENRKKKICTGLVIAAVLILLTGVVYAVANSTWLTEIIGSFFSQKSAQELAGQTTSGIDITYELGDLIINVLEAAILPDGKLYMSAKVALREGTPGILLHDAAVPSEPAYANAVYRDLQDPNLDLATAPTYTDLAKKRGEKLLKSHVWIEAGYGETGYVHIEQKDESYLMVVENTVSVKDGSVPLRIGALMYEMTMDGDEVEGTRIQNEWTLTIPVKAEPSVN